MSYLDRGSLYRAHVLRWAFEGFVLGALAVGLAFFAEIRWTAAMFWIGGIAMACALPFAIWQVYAWAGHAKREDEVSERRAA